MEEETPTEIDSPVAQRSLDSQKPTVACLRCRDQKLRCDRELPSCERCRKQRAACTYPAPPDRKLIAQRTNRARASKSTIEKEVNSATVLSASVVRPSKRQRISENDDPEILSTFRLEQEQEHAELPSTEIGLLLLETYFKRIYNSTLMFHKTIAVQVYLQNRTPACLLRAMFAHAALFLRDVDPSNRDQAHITPIPSVFERSWAWARSASVEALAHADEPCLIRIQTLQVLELYYFSQGESQRALVHASLAYRLSQLLGFDTMYEAATGFSTSQGTMFEREMRRRTFWAGWCSLCINGEPSEAPIVLGRGAGLPLPALFEIGGSIHGVGFTLGERMDKIWDSSADTSDDYGTSGSLMAEMTKLLSIWAKVQTFVSFAPKQSESERLNDLEDLNQSLVSLERSLELPLTNIDSRSNFFEEGPELLVSISSVYHLSQILIHASMVPAFSSSLAQASTSRQMVERSTKIVFAQAIAFAELLHLFVTKGLDITRLWPLTGYGAFIVGNIVTMQNRTVHSPSHPQQVSQTPKPESPEMKTLQKVLNVLSLYWRPLSVLANQLQVTLQEGADSGIDLCSSKYYPWNADF